jgi:hypothetical protein
MRHVATGKNGNLDFSASQAEKQGIAVTIRKKKQNFLCALQSIG